MNQVQFACRNVIDKINKSVSSAPTFRFYVENYLLSAFERDDPDHLVISYPKCGRTWVRMLVQNYLRRQNVPDRKFFRKNCLAMPDGKVLMFGHHKGNWVPAPLRRQQLRLDPEMFSDKNVAFLVRDPRDVLVSSWHHLKFRENVYRGSLSEFLRDDLVGVRKVVAFMNLWVEEAESLPHFMLMRYEALHRDPGRELERFLNFVGISPDPDSIRMAVENSTFARLKDLESQKKLDEPWMRPGSNGNSAMKIRKGKPGGFKDELSEPDLAYLDEVLKTELAPELSDYIRG